MSQQVPFDNSGAVPLGNDMVAAGYADAAPGYVPQDMGGMSGGGGMDGGGGYLPPAQGPQSYARNRAPMIDPIESAKITPQILVLLVLSGLRRHWKWSLPLGMVLGLLAAGILYLAFPLQYEATAQIRIRSERQQFLGTEVQVNRYNEFVNTQLALMRSPVVLDRVFEMPDIAQLPVVLKQQDRRAWLRKQLSTKLDGRSEIVAITIGTDAPDASEKIVNAVVDTFFVVIEEAARQNESKVVANLTAERTRLSNSTRQLQEEIRRNTERAAAQGGAAGASGLAVGLAQGESLARDVALESAKLVAMQATRDASRERVANPGRIPGVVLMQLDPALQHLSTERQALQQKRDNTAQTSPDPEKDPRVQRLDRQLKDMDDRMGRLITDADGNRTRAILDQFREREEMQQYFLDQEIRTQEILVETLKKRQDEQLLDNVERSSKILDTSFDLTQLARNNKVLDAIEDQLITIRNEQRAPQVIIPLTPASSSKPTRMRQYMVVGMGAIIFSFFPLLLSVAVERLKPRLYHVSQVRRSIQQVLIGEIMEPPVSWIQGATFRKRLARYRESVHNWCTHLLLSDPFRSCRTLSIASVAGDDGKTFLAVQIAVAMAQMKSGNVLLIDGDMRVGRLHLLFGNEEAGIGLADVLSFRNGFGEAMVQNEKEPNLHLLSAGQLDVTPYELLGDGRFRELLDMLEQNYALILVVLPPIANAAESLIMAASTDSTLLCVRQGETVLAAMEDVYRKLVNTGGSVDGIVVKDIPYYQMAGKDGGFADKLEQIRLSHLLQYAE